MSSSLVQWWSLKRVILCSSSLLISGYGILAVKSIKFDQTTQAIASTSNPNSNTSDCQSPTSNLSSSSQWLSASAPKTLNQSSPLTPIDCITAVLPFEQGSTNRKIIISPKTFPDLWNAAKNTLNQLPKPFPTIHEQARIAKVPILMYHDILPKKEVFLMLPLKNLKPILN